MNIYEELEKIDGREAFIAFVHRLTNDLEHNREAWANPTLEDYLQGIASWVEDGVEKPGEAASRFPGTEKIKRRSDVEWERLAFLLFAAGRYE
ncbi:hypothetical protein QWJ34_24790 [Saccharibacillus sp. CPCC 101409]|uniref:DUF7660 family protein n=1 Tax=Saccharibacillus sp. CPCC 101409 TaxID=3058041 RepID=UPI002671AFDE|nr:hypothetical protein [Saccharibacillus sp. CPCC 101409]MDO3413004.1 hypothetical protein [Saccharibacillus sp. CPCC 101409]